MVTPALPPPELTFTRTLTRTLTLIVRRTDRLGVSIEEVSVSVVGVAEGCRRAPPGYAGSICVSSRRPQK